MRNKTVINSFDSIDATIYGIEEAVILNLIEHISAITGEEWVKLSMAKARGYLPYMTERQIRWAIQNLVEEKAIETKRNNTDPFDRTLSYRIIEEGRIRNGRL